jgi:ribosome recycling factor
MSPELKIYEEKMNKTLSVMTSEFASIRAGRANPAVLDKVLVDYYGTPTKIREMASVSVSEARVLVIQPYDKGSLKNIERAIQTSDIGINPANDGTVLRLTFPQLTEERRKEIVKQVSRLAEDSKVAIRSIRRDANDRFKAMKKNGEATEDDVKSLETQMQKLTDKFIAEIDKLADAKEKEVLSI